MSFGKWRSWKECLKPELLYKGRSICYTFGEWLELSSFRGKCEGWIWEWWTEMRWSWRFLFVMLSNLGFLLWQWGVIEEFHVDEWCQICFIKGQFWDWTVREQNAFYPVRDQVRGFWGSSCKRHWFGLRWFSEWLREK